MNDPNTTQQTEFVLRRVLDGLHLGGTEYSGWFWLAILIPVLLLGFVYVVWMYVRDGRSVGWMLATFMALLRCTVYVILAAVFLPPAPQRWDKARTQAKVVILGDVSAISGSRDGIPTEGIPAEKLPTRQDEVINFLSDKQI